MGKRLLYSLFMLAYLPIIFIGMAYTVFIALPIAGVGWVINGKEVESSSVDYAMSAILKLSDKIFHNKK